MSDEIQNEVQEEVSAKDELSLLKERAAKLGINVKGNISAAKLKEKIEAKLNPTEEDQVAPPVAKSSKESPAQVRVRLNKEARALVRVIVTCMDPLKKDYPGELFTFGNSAVSTIKRYVPFDTEWHVERGILNMIKGKQAQIFRTEKTQNGVSVRKSKLIKAYNIEELKPLTKEELEQLAKEQAAGDRI